MVENSSQQNDFKNSTTIILRITIIILIIVFIVGFFLPWLHYIPLEEDGEDDFYTGFNDMCSGIAYFMITTAIILILILFLSFFKKSKNNFIVVFFIALALSLLIIRHIHLLFEYHVGPHPRLERNFSFGIFISLIAIGFATFLTLILAHLENQHTYFAKWNIQKKLFVLILLLFFLTTVPFHFYQISIILGLLILIITIIESNNNTAKYILIWLLIFPLAIFHILLVIGAQTLESIFWLLLVISLIVILIQSHRSLTDIFKFEYEKEPQNLLDIIFKPQKSVATSSNNRNIITPQPVIIKGENEKPEIIKQYIELFKIDVGLATNLYNAGYTSFKEFKDAIPEDLIMVKGIDFTLAKEIIRIMDLINK